MEQFADVFNRGVLEKVVPGSVVISRQNLLNGLFHIGEVHQHAILWTSFDNTLDLIGVTVEYSAFGMTGQRVSAINVVYDADFHDRLAG